MTAPEGVGANNRLECNCGLVVVCDDAATLLRIIEAHDCPAMYDDTDSDDEGDGRWWHRLFSLEGAMIIFFIFLLLSDLIRGIK